MSAARVKSAVTDVKIRSIAAANGSSGQRQCVERLVGHAAIREHLPRQIQIRQRSLEDDRGSLETTAWIGVLFDGSDKSRQLFFAITEHERIRLRALVEAPGNHHDRRLVGRGPTFLLEAGQEVVEPLVKARGQHRFGCDDIDVIEMRQPAQEIEVGRPQPVRIGSLISHRHHNVAIDRARRFQRQRSNANVRRWNPSQRRPLRSD